MVPCNRLISFLTPNDKPILIYHTQEKLQLSNYPIPSYWFVIRPGRRSPLTKKLSHVLPQSFLVRPLAKIAIYTLVSLYTLTFIDNTLACLKVQRTKSKCKLSRCPCQKLVEYFSHCTQHQIIIPPMGSRFPVVCD